MIAFLLNLFCPACGSGNTRRVDYVKVECVDCGEIFLARAA
jgi:ribosomal protein S27AE